jgi:hypothetical protein
MKKIYLALAAMFLITLSYAQNDIVVDPNAETRDLNGSFNAIKVSGGIDIYLSQSDNNALAISAVGEKYRAAIKTVVENNILNISFDGDKGWNKKDRKLRAYISFSELKKINASGASDVFVIGSVTVTALEIQMSGACNFKGMVKVNTLKLNLSGASDVKVSGTANTVEIESTGASDVKGFDLVTDFCNAKLTGASDVKITVNKELSANATGASDIKYKGTAAIKEVHSSGASSIKKVD